MICPVCQKEAVKSCSACKLVSYCSTDCQKADWKVHKKSCCAFILKKNEDGNIKKYSMIASRDIKQGSIILDEEPLFLVSEMFDSVGFMIQNERFLCIVCGSHLIPSTLKTCSKCNWSVCGPCEKLSFHADNECKLFVSENIRINPYRMSEFAHIVTLGRAHAVKTNHPQQWEDLMDLVNWDKVGSSYKDVIPSIAFEVEQLDSNRASKLPHAKILGTEEAMDTFQRVRFISKRMGFYYQAEEYGAMTDDLGHQLACARGGSYIYKKSSALTHSCSPNCVSSVGTSPEFKLRVRTAVDIKKGQVLTVSYIHKDYEGRRGTIPRGEVLLNRFGQKCHCTRCLDPTELGSFISAVTCTVCRDKCRFDYEQEEKWRTERYDESTHGFFLPQDSLDWSDEALWKCNRCQRVLTLGTFRPLLKEIQAKIDINGRTGGQELVKEITNKHLGIDLHPNHWLMQFITQIYLFRTRCGDTKKEMEKYVRHCEHMLAIEDMIFPGLSFYRAWIQTHASNMMMQRLMYPHFTAVNIEEQAKVQLEDLKRCFGYQEKAYAFYKHEPPKRGGGSSFFADKLQKDQKMCMQLMVPYGFKG